MVKKKNLNYEEVAKNIIANIGDKESINSIRHCVARVRFRLKDENKADDEIIKNLEGAFPVVHGGGEYMTVIGDVVEDVYDVVCVQLGMQNGAGSEIKAEEEEKVNPTMRVLSMIVGAVLPCLDMICAGGIIKGLQTVFQMTSMVPSGSGMDLIISAMGDAILSFLPVFPGMNLARASKGDGFLSALIGVILCYPTIDGVNLELFGHTINATYTSSSLSVIAVTAVAIPLARWLNKYTPKVVVNFMIPVITLVAVTPFGSTPTRPAINMAGSLVNTGITASLNTVPLFAGIIFSALYQVTVLFGIHTVLTSFSFMSFLEGNPDTVIVMSCLIYFTQTGVALGVYCKAKDRKLRSIALPAFTSGLFGITEPVIYGVTLPRIKMFVLFYAGAGITGAIIMLIGMKMYSFDLGVLTVLGMVNLEAPNFTPPLLVVVVLSVVPFMLAYVLCKGEAVPVFDPAQITPGSETAAHEKFIIESPVPGKVVPVGQVPDETFSSGTLGKGFAVEPSEGKVYASSDGTRATIFETLHAMGLELSNGVSLLIYVGLETVGLNGKPLKAHVGSGDDIKKGQLLLEFDMDEIKAAGCPVITSVLVANESEIGKVAIESDKIVAGG